MAQLPMTESEFNDMVDETFEAFAARAGGSHFAWSEQAGDWCDTRDDTAFRAFLAEQVKVQGGIDFAWA
jgi:frataxin-like iron-binding protein CyaY